MNKSNVFFWTISVNWYCNFCLFRRGDIEVMKLLIQHKADVKSSRTDNQRTAIHIMVTNRGGHIYYLLRRNKIWHRRDNFTLFPHLQKFNGTGLPNILGLFLFWSAQALLHFAFLSKPPEAYLEVPKILVVYVMLYDTVNIGINFFEFGLLSFFLGRISVSVGSQIDRQMWPDRSGNNCPPLRSKHIYSWIKVKNAGSLQKIWKNIWSSESWVSVEINYSRCIAA